MTSDVEYFFFFIYLFAILVSLMRYLLRSWPVFNQVFIFSLYFKSSLCILDDIPLSDVPFANTFSQFAACLLIL